MNKLNNVPSHKNSPAGMLNRVRIAAYCGITVTFLAFAEINSFFLKWRFPSKWPESVTFILQTVLFVTLVTLAIRWIAVTYHEMRLWLEWLDNPAPEWKAYVAIIVLPLTLGICLAYVYKIIIVTFVFTAFLLLNYWTQWLSNDHVIRALPKSRNKFNSKSQLAILSVLEHYWLKRPQLARITTMMFFSSIAFSVALAGSVQKGPQMQALHSLAAGILVFTVVIGEIVITLWRFKREREILEVNEGNIRKASSHQPKDELAKPANEEDIKNFSLLSYPLIFGFAGLWVTIVGTAATLSPAVQSSSLLIPLTWNSPYLVISSILFCLELLFLCITWILATKHELSLWIRWLKNPIDQLQAGIAILSLAFVLGTALAFFYSIIFISAFLTVYLLVNYWAQWISNDHFERALRLTKEDFSLTNTSREVLQIMEVYWVVRPQLARITTLMFFASMGFSMALAGFFQNGPRKNQLYCASYCILFFDIFIGEFVIYKWRRKRDRDIMQARQPEE